MVDIFVSYAHEDVESAGCLVRAFEAEGWAVWWDQTIPAGQSFPRQIREALEKAKCVVVLWSRHAIASDYVESEVIRARDRQVLLTATIEDVQIPVPFNTLQAVSLRDWKGDRQAEGFRLLLKAALPLLAAKPGPDAARQPPESWDPPDPREAPPGVSAEEDGLQQRLARLQIAATKLPSSGSRTDEALGALTRFAADLGEAVRYFPEGMADLQELLLSWHAAVDDRLACDPAPMTRLLLSQARSRLLAMIARAQGPAPDEAAEPAGVGGPRVPSGLPLDSRRLASHDPIERSDAVDVLLRDGFASAEAFLAGLAGEEKHRVLASLWRSWPRIRLYHGKTATPLATFASRADPGFWRPRLEAYGALLEISEPEGARAILDRWHGVDRGILAETMLVHRSLPCRQMALATLDPVHRWDTVLFSGTPMLIVREIVLKSCEDCDPEFMKAMFLLVRRRLEDVTRGADLKQAYEILVAFYRLPLFLEEEFFTGLLELHNALSEKALPNPELAHLEQASEELFQSFCSKEKMVETDIAQMAHVPLPIQRKLARDGHFIGYFICNVRDTIALETVPHVMRRADVVKYLELKRINGQALEKLASDRTVMREYSHRLAFCHNPRAKGALVVTHMSSLRKTDVDDIAADKNASQFAREQAKRLRARLLH